MTESEALGKLHEDAQAIFREAIHAVDAREAVLRNLSVDPESRLLKIGQKTSVPLGRFRRALAIGAGKAGAAMASALEDVIGPVFELSGLVNVKYGHTTPQPRFISLNQCGHPLPDAGGVKGAREIERLLAELTEEDLLFVLISGGASALLPAPAEEISLEEKQIATDHLLKAGADIVELNTVRKHLSTLKGGQLAIRAGGATVVSLILSDVIGDQLDVIGSGLTAPDPSTFSDALQVIGKYGLERKIPSAVLRRLSRGADGDIPETPKATEFAGRPVHNVVIGSNMLAIRGAAQAARTLGYQTLILSSTLQGEAREVARVHAEIMREMISSGNPLPPPACVLSGGETTVTVIGSGKGGRNQEFALATAIQIKGLPRAVMLAAGTDGTDGPTNAAGGIIDGNTHAQAVSQGLCPVAALRNNDSYSILAATGRLFQPGATGTNVMDLNVILIAGA